MAEREERLSFQHLLEDAALHGGRGTPTLYRELDQALSRTQQWIDSDRSDGDALEAAMLSFLHSRNWCLQRTTRSMFHSLCAAVGRHPSIQDVSHDDTPAILADATAGYMSTARRPHFACAPLLQQTQRWGPDAETLLFTLHDFFVSRDTAQSFPDGPRHTLEMANAGLAYARAHEIALKHFDRAGADVMRELPHMLGAQFWIRCDRARTSVPAACAILQRTLAELHECST